LRSFSIFSACSRSSFSTRSRGFAFHGVKDFFEPGRDSSESQRHRQMRNDTQHSNKRVQLTDFMVV
jgi:hypothetical protein